jgi:TonB family protein
MNRPHPNPPLRGGFQLNLRIRTMIKILSGFLIFFSITCFTQIDSTKNNEVETITCFPRVDSLPQIIGGLDSLQSRLKYPGEAIENGIEGNVFVKVHIDSSGIPSNPVILKGLGYGCDEEAIRLILTSNYFPALASGKRIKSQIMIRIKFKLTK